jgi:hypothetical protein
MHLLSEAAFLVVRSPKLAEIVGPGQSDSLTINEMPSCLCLDHQVVNLLLKLLNLKDF